MLLHVNKKNNLPDERGVYVPLFEALDHLEQKPRGFRHPFVQLQLSCSVITPNELRMRTRLRSVNHAQIESNNLQSNAMYCQYRRKKSRNLHPKIKIIVCYLDIICMSWAINMGIMPLCCLILNMSLQDQQDNQE